MNERAMDRIVRSVSFAGNVLFYGIVFTFIMFVAALLSYIEPIKRVIVQ